MTLENINKHKQYLRLLISYNDFKQAAEIASLILSEDYFNKRKKIKGNEGYKIKVLWESLSCTMIIAYCRPFTNNDKKKKSRIPDLNTKILSCLNKEELDLHNILLSERNTMLAHSDSEAWNLNPRYIQYKGKDTKILIPGHNDVRAPLLPEPTKTIEKMCYKLMEEVFKKRMTLENELEHEFPVELIKNKENNE